MKKTNCHICNSKLVTTDIKGHAFPWKDFSRVELLVSYEALACSKCSEVLIQGKNTDSLDEALEESVRIQTATFLHKVKEQSKISQKALARKICLSEVYLSEIIGKKKTVSSQIFNYLKIIANHPAALKDLDDFKGNDTRRRTAMGGEIELAYIGESNDMYKYLNKEECRELQGKRCFERILDAPAEEVLH